MPVTGQTSLFDIPSLKHDLRSLKMKALTVHPESVIEGTGYKSRIYTLKPKIVMLVRTKCVASAITYAQIDNGGDRE